MVKEAATISRTASVDIGLVFVLAKFIVVLNDSKHPAHRAFELYAPVKQRAKAELESLKRLATQVRERLPSTHTNVLSVDQMVQLCVAWNMNAQDMDANELGALFYTAGALEHSCLSNTHFATYDNQLVCHVCSLCVPFLWCICAGDRACEERATTH